MILTASPIALAEDAEADGSTEELGRQLTDYGKKLDRHGYLMDICEVEASLDKLVGYFRDKNLNSLPEFEGLNPSIEHFARIYCRAMLSAINRQPLAALSIKIWENEAAWAEYREDF